MMVSKKGYQPLDADREAYIRHGRDGLPTVWSRLRYSCGRDMLQRPDGRGVGRVVECSEGLLLSLEQCYSSCWNAVSWVKNCLVEVACEPLNDYRVFEEVSACSFDRSLAGRLWAVLAWIVRECRDE